MISEPRLGRLKNSTWSASTLSSCLHRDMAAMDMNLDAQAAPGPGPGPSGRPGRLKLASAFSFAASSSCSSLRSSAPRPQNLTFNILLLGHPRRSDFFDADSDSPSWDAKVLLRPGRTE